MAVLSCADISLDELENLLARFTMELHRVDDKNPIPGSWFGEPEAGLIENRLYIRDDTPVHSALHESCHYICMPAGRREQLHTNAGGDYDEENAVCYLSILLSDFIQGFGRQRMFSDMDEWGYTFRLGSSQAWFEKDTDDTLDWLRQYNLLDSELKPSWNIRQ